MKNYLQFMKRAVLALIFSVNYFSLNSQSKLIKEVFRNLPADKVYDLTIGTRDSMLQGKTYYPDSNDSIEVQAYNYGISETVKDYMYVSLSFETGQRGTGMIEIRNFKTTKGENIILFSRTGGVWQVSYNQHEVSFFRFGNDKKLSPYKKKFLLPSDERIFMKPGIPDSIKNIILNNSNMVFDLSHEKLVLSLNSIFLSNNENVRKWLKGDRIYFDWIKDDFVVSKIDFDLSD